jgi:hypothetical protein
MGTKIMPTYPKLTNRVAILKELYDDKILEVFGMRSYHGRAVSRKEYEKLIEIEKHGTELEKMIYETGEYAAIEDN